MLRRLAALLLLASPLGACEPDASTDGAVAVDLAPPADLAEPDLTLLPDLMPPPPDLMPPPVVRFVAMGDTGRANQAQRDVATAVANKCAADGCDFIQLLGDNIYDNGVDGVTDAQWQDKFELPYRDIALPFFVVLGNHDYGGWGLGNEFIKGQYQIDYSKTSMKWKLPAAYWRRVDKHVELFGLDTNMVMYYQDAQQRNEVGGWIAASLAQWKIVFGHHPYLSNGPHGNAGTYDNSPFVPIVNGLSVKSFFDDLVCGKADLYIAGHDHSLQWIKPTCKGTELLISGAGSSVTWVAARNPSYYQSDKLGFLYVVIIGNQLTAEFIDSTGKTEFSRTLTK